MKLAQAALIAVVIVGGALLWMAGSSGTPPDAHMLYGAVLVWAGLTGWVRLGLD